MKNKLIPILLLTATMAAGTYMMFNTTEDKVPEVQATIQEPTVKEVEYEAFISKMDELGYEDGITLVLGEKFDEETLREKGLKYLETYNSFESQKVKSLPDDFSIIYYMKLNETRSFRDLINLVMTEYPDFMNWAYIGENHIFGEQVITDDEVPDMNGSTSIISAVGSTYMIIDTSNPEKTKELLKELGMPYSK